MVVQTLCHEVQCQRVLDARGLLDLGPLVLEPDLDLRLVEAELGCQTLPPLFRQVTVRLELGLQPLQLLGRERRPRALVLFTAALLWSAGSRTCRGRIHTEVYSKPTNNKVSVLV